MNPGFFQKVYDIYLDSSATFENVFNSEIIFFLENRLFSLDTVNTMLKSKYPIGH